MGIRDTRMMAAAIEGRYPITEQHLAAVISAMLRITLDANNYSARERTAAARAVMSAHGQNLQRAAMNQQQNQHNDNRNDERLDRLARIAERLGHHGVAAAIISGRSDSAINGPSADDDGGTGV